MTTLPPELEAAIVAAPHDREVYAVAGDWLSDRGDPRGELVALQLAVSSNQVREEADNDRILELQTRLAPIATGRDGHAALEWRWGFVHGASYSGADPGELERLLAAPVARFLHKLVLPSATPQLVERLSAMPLHCLRTLMIGRGLGSTLDLDLDRIRMPGLQRLGLRAPRTHGRLDLPQLRELSLAELPTADRFIASSDLPALEKLQLGSLVTPPPLDGWLQKAYVPALRRLTFGVERPFSFAPTPAAPPAEILEQLVVLDQFVATRGTPGSRIITVDRTVASDEAGLLVMIGRGPLRPGALIPISKEFSIGSGPGALVLSDPQIKARHAEIRRHARWTIHAHEDSLFHVEGHAIADSTLRDGDEIAIGRHVVLFLEHDIAAKADVLRRRYGF